MFTPDVPPKLDVAARHIESAILLWAMAADPRSVHLLVMAADEIIGAYAKAVGKIPALDIDSKIRPEMMGHWLRAKRKASNYFKHADRDPLTPYDGPDGEQLASLNELSLLQSWINLREMEIGLAEHTQWLPRGIAFLYPDIIFWDSLPAGARATTLIFSAQGDPRKQLRQITLASALKYGSRLSRDLELALQAKNELAFV